MSTWVITLDLLPSGEPPTEFRIFAMGENVTSKGTFIMDAEAAAAVMADIAKQGMDRLPIDYEHGMVLPKSAPEQSVAAGWFVPELRSDGLWATDVQWTERAATMLRAREYRFLSPAFRKDGNNRVVKLWNVALTNLPATQNALPLVASQQAGEAAPPEGYTMSDTLLKAIGASDEGEAHLIVAEWNRTSAELLSATGTKSLSDAMEAVHANAKLPAEVKRLSDELTERDRADGERQRDALIAKLSEEGALPPALHEWAKTQSVESLSAFGEAAPRDKSPKAAPGEPTERPVILSAEDEEIIASTGIDREIFIAERKLEQSKKGR